MKKSKSPIKFARSRAGSDVWLGLIGVIMALAVAENEELYLPMTGTLYRLIGLTVQTRAGTRTLKLGNAEGQSVSY